MAVKLFRDDWFPALRRVPDSRGPHRKDRDARPPHGRTRDIDAIEQDRAFGGAIKPGHQPHQRRLVRKCQAKQQVQRPTLKRQACRMDILPVALRYSA